MSSQHACHDHGRIEQLLEGRLTPDQQTQLESHLEVCTHCRDQLENSAAEQAYWQQAAVHLRDDALDTEVGAMVSEPEGCFPEKVLDTFSEALRIADYFDPTDDPRMLGRFGGYEVVGVIGCGGMGVVLKGYEAALDRYVAIKLLALHLATSGAARTRFAREARAAAAVLHENVVAIHRVAEDKGLPYLVMPYMPGESLQKRLDQEGPMQLGEILRIGMQIAAGLAAAHAQGLIHRDIKPGNILLDKGVERLTITDFGLARAADDASLTRSGVIAGTPQYMSPEQARGQPLDSRSDLFSLGSVMYALCVGRPPFRAETAFGVLHRIAESDPTAIRHHAPETPEWLCEIIAKLHAKNPGDRFQSAGEVAALLGRWLAHVEQPTVIPPPPRPTDRLRRTKRLRRIAAAAVLLIAAIGVGVVINLPSPAGRGAGGEGESRATSPTAPETRAGGVGGEQLAAQTNASPHPNPLPAGEGTNSPPRNPIAAISDDRPLLEACGAVHGQILRLEQEWSPSASPLDDAGWRSETSELHRRLDDLGRRIDHNLP